MSGPHCQWFPPRFTHLWGRFTRHPRSCHSPLHGFPRHSVTRAPTQPSHHRYACYPPGSCHSVPFTLPSVHAVGGSPKGATRRGTPPAVRRALRGEWIGREPTWQRNEEPTRWTSGVGTREEPWDARPLFLCSFVTLHLMVRLSGSSLIPSPSPSRRRPRSDCKERAESEASREAAVRREWWGNRDTEGPTRARGTEGGAGMRWEESDRPSGSRFTRHFLSSFTS